MGVTAIIAAGGVGRRFGECAPKQFLFLKGKEIIRWSIETFIKSNFFNEIIIPAPYEFMSDIEKITDDYKNNGFVIKVVKGGDTRAESVRNAVEASYLQNELILIHDAARPFVSVKNLCDFFSFTSDKDAVIFAKKVTETVKLVKGNEVQETLDRERIFLAQTPQIFKKSVLLDAYKKTGDNFKGFTDEASLIEKMGLKVFVFEGNSYNIKITIPEDLKMAECIAEFFFSA
jgi:2-C-methyl-D-erythritol 4-phosphate cytidylyltransferase